ncbi:trypsin-like peptidase domain-containing protein [Candidatus Microgenomates bacterium]|nr:trypsin-like peptidase domain-containing protein [Candidatus Microgenomates bacterium]
MKRVIILLTLLILLIGIGVSSGQFKLNIGNLDKYLKLPQKTEISTPSEKVKIVSEESVVIDVVDKVSPSVVTVSISKTRSLSNLFETNPFDPFFGFQQQQPQRQQKIEQDIGTGFIISENGQIVTNKHVVADTNAKYKVITNDDKSYDVQKIFRDPGNDIAILQIEAKNLKPVTLGDSGKIKVGQMAIAIGTALGEFRNTVTVGIISGLGRGITAGSPFEGYVERLDNIIQTDAAINPGNSGGPLLNSSAEVVGLNTAVSSDGQSIGFAIPINVLKESLESFSKNGKFQKPFLGVKYKMITKDLALLNDVPEGAYVQDVVEKSPAEKAGIEPNDIITKLDGQKITDKEDGLAKIISGKSIGSRMTVEIWRDGETKLLTVTVGEYTGE